MNTRPQSASDRRIRLLTGEILDLAQPNLGHPDGLALWDRLSIGDGNHDRRVSTHDTPSARCLFPLCEDTGTGLILVNPTHGRRYARHFKGEGGSRTHRVADHADQSPIVDWLCRRFDHAGWPVGTEHSFTADDGSHEQLRRSDYLVGLGKATLPIAGEVQNRRTNHRQRAADARKAGYVSLWTPTKHGDNLRGVAQLRFTSTFDEAASNRDPASVPMAGFADLDLRNLGGRWTLYADLRRVRMGQIAEELPGGGWVEFWATRNQVLFVPPEHAARFAEHERRSADDIRSGPADGILRRHRQLMRQQAEAAAVERHASTTFLDDEPAPPAAATLDWSAPRHYANRDEPCARCKRPTRMRSDRGNPWHKPCAEAFLTDYPGAPI